ncbi:phage tail sheath family protein [Lachnotalea glycerini]|uniref:Phage tail sheath family protein n=1 Tax=Lachnotalea glycerini TaxID=1763509 RepID=A0A371J7E2_9FIRM|nr:phage tail sheath family protein [Lachnotalea glycerini]RDY28655.1 phage tail sheath family protein [Lachnotalea glycerini]
MATYQHGIRVQENPTSLASPITGSSGLQVIFGTAPINLAKDPYKATNQLFVAYSFEEAQAAVGYSSDYENYTLCQSMDASFKVFHVAPIILCNVLDPTIHKKANSEADYAVTNKQACINTKGILLDTVVVKNDGNTLTQDMDYVLSFDEDGYVVVSLLSSGVAYSATTLNVSSTSIDPTAVTSTDIIGGYDAETGKESGIELVRKVYPKFNLVPGLLLAPGWSHIAEVGAALDAKSERINEVYTCENILDIDTTKAKKYTDVEEIKNTNGYTSKHSIVLWPMISVDGVKYYYSAIYGALVAYTDASNDDVPSLSPSNKILGATGTVLKDGTEIDLDQAQANVLNSQGIVTALNDAGWRSWGNNMACYPGNKDIKDRWICCRRFFTWWSNTFILSYKEKVDNLLNYALIESIVDAENIRGNSYVSQGKCAGARMQFNMDDNPQDNILEGKIQFKQWLAPYTPAEDILNVLEFDPTMIEAALGGE